MKIEVSNCHECPFVIEDDLHGYYACSLNDEIENENFPYNEETGRTYHAFDMPKDRVHRLCPLKQSSVLVKLK